MSLRVAFASVVWVAIYGPITTGVCFSPHLELAAMFWWGDFYGFCQRAKLERTGLLHLTIGFVGSDGLSGVSFVAMSEETGVAVEACRVG